MLFQCISITINITSEHDVVFVRSFSITLILIDTPPEENDLYTDFILTKIIRFMVKRSKIFPFIHIYKHIYKSVNN